MLSLVFDLLAVKPDAVTLFLSEKGEMQLRDSATFNLTSLGHLRLNLIVAVDCPYMTSCQY